jgi:ADP-ribose pyrophosphatase YjhB (NUDIX family)
MFCSSCGARLSSRPPATCASCGAQHWNDAKPCASALVVKDSKVLLVRRAQDPWKDCWDVPGGFCNANEHPVATAEREVFEETGIRIRVTGFLGIWLDDYPTADDETKRTLNVYYHAVPVDAEPAQLDREEVEEIRFFGADELPSALAFLRHVPAALAAGKRAMAAGQLETALLDVRQTAGATDAGSSAFTRISQI